MVDLAACLTLCAPTGMNAADRKEWLTVAFPRISEIPADLLAEACSHVQDTCDHPAKIIPAIKAFTKERWDSRRVIRSEILRDQIVAVEEPEPWIPEPGELERIKAEAADRLKAERRD